MTPRPSRRSWRRPRPPPLRQPRRPPSPRPPADDAAAAVSRLYEGSIEGRAGLPGFPASVAGAALPVYGTRLMTTDLATLPGDDLDALRRDAAAELAAAADLRAWDAA